ncbi:hypothetical protein CVT25_015822 [Psilocybe cyanescens]|uniref:Uncharacterized protein n=1 Tax=Psilocybe cyanescens TaxID=93625 RepID=A0A409XIE9_PSICY|nr:hypothetical protein CVT25_015822 [Psilocybe cyanescens]
MFLEAEIDQLVQVLLDALKGGYGCSMNSLLHQMIVPTGRQFNLHANVRAAITGEVHVICIGPDISDVVGTSIWFPQSASPFSRRVSYLLEKQRAARLNQILENMPDYLQKWCMEYVCANFAMRSITYCLFIPTDYELDVWHLHYLTVMKSHHGKECCRAMFELAAAQEAAIAYTGEGDQSAYYIAYNKRNQFPVFIDYFISYIEVAIYNKL